MRLLPRTVRRFDRRVSDAVYSWPSPKPVDDALQFLSRTAGSSKFWLLLAAALALTGQPGRRAARRGLLALGTASGIVNLLAKGPIGAHRPHGHGYRHHRHPGTVPSSASLPSGHSASAAGFITAVWLVSPICGAAIAPVAGAAAYARLHLGQHWFIDIAAGTLAGATTAALLRLIA